MSTGNGITGWFLLLAGVGLGVLTIVTWANVFRTGDLPGPPNAESNTAGVLCAPPVGAILLIAIGCGMIGQTRGKGRDEDR